MHKDLVNLETLSNLKSDLETWIWSMGKSIDQLGDEIKKYPQRQILQEIEE